MESSIAQWAVWQQVHENPDQKRRVKFALSAECTPLSVDPASASAAFVGSHGERYHTELSFCPCSDFSIRGQSAPCKHMYRLAMELSLFPSEGMATDVNAPVVRLAQFRLLRFMREAPFSNALAVYQFLDAVYNRTLSRSKPIPDPILDQSYLLDLSSPIKYKRVKAYQKDVEKLSEALHTRIAEAVWRLSDDEMVRLMDRLER